MEALNYEAMRSTRFTVMTLGVSRFGAATLKSEFGIRPSLSIFIDSSIDVAGQPTDLH